MPTPGIYLINSTGESHALLLEDGSGDEQLLEDMLETHGYTLVHQSTPSPGVVLGKLLANAGLLTMVAAVWITLGQGAGLVVLGLYLLLLGYAQQQQSGGEE